MIVALQRGSAAGKGMAAKTADSLKALSGHLATPAQEGCFAQGPLFHVNPTQNAVPCGA